MSARSSRRSAVAWLVSTLAVIVGCRDAPKDEGKAPARETEVVVFAASSLGDAFRALVPAFERAHPGARVTFQFAGSQELRTQIEHGTAADVFASADTRHMDALEAAKRVSGVHVFARNEPVVVVAKDEREDLRAFADLARAERVVIGEASVPIGRYTLEILDRASGALGGDFRTRVEGHVISRELNVRQVLAKVTLGEADAAIVYRTDALSAKEQVAVITIPAELNVVATYPIAEVSGAAHPTLARAFVDLVRSQEGRDVLAAHGFLVDAKSVP